MESTEKTRKRAICDEPAPGWHALRLKKGVLSTVSASSHMMGERHDTTGRSHQDGGGTATDLLGVCLHGQGVEFGLGSGKAFERALFAEDGEHLR